MKNTTLDRKATNDMKRDTSVPKTKTSPSQMGDGEDFAFNGQMGDGVNRAPNRFAGNYANQTMKENFGSGPTNPADLRKPSKVEGSVTKDKFKEAPSRAKDAGVTGETTVKKFSNPDKINVK